MRKIIVALVILSISGHATAGSNPACSMDYNSAKEAAKNRLLNDYPDSFSTVKMLLDNNMDSYEKLCKIPNTQPHHGILKRLANDYPSSWSTILMLYENNIKAYNELNQ